MGERDWHYCRPSGPGDVPTSHLMLCGPPAALESFDAVLRRAGAICISRSAGHSHCFASFDSPASATAASQAVVATATSRDKILLRYVDARPSENKQRINLDVPVPAERTAESCGIPGLMLLLDFITSEEEAALLRCIDQQPWEYLSRRRVQHYGKTFCYITRKIDTEAPTSAFPPMLESLRRRLSALPGIGNLDQLTVNEYTLGVGLSPHVDTHSAFAGSILSLSLAGSAAMQFRRGGERRALLLPPRCLLIMTGESRFGWEHSIPHRKSDPLVDGDVVQRSLRRVSLTFRLVQQEPCACPYPEFCESQGAPIPPSRMLAKLQQEKEARQGGQLESAATHSDNGNSSASACVLSACAGATCCSSDSDHSGGDANSGEERKTESGGCSSRGCSSSGGDIPSQLEDTNVRDVYDAIAPHFGATRFAVWPKVRVFIQSLPYGGLVADVGCGNGKYFGVRKDIFVMGSDRSRGIAEIAFRRLYPPGLPARQRPMADVLAADAMALPYRRRCCDGVLCIAVLHHISNVERRLRLLREIVDILVPGGRALVTVWATEQENMDKVAKWEPIAVPVDSGEGVFAEGTGTGTPHAATAYNNAAAVGGQDYLVPWHLPLHRAEAAAAAGATATSNVDAAKNALVFRRFYHLFAPGELESLVERVPGAEVVDSFYDKDNWCVVFRRKECE